MLLSTAATSASSGLENIEPEPEPEPEPGPGPGPAGYVGETSDEYDAVADALIEVWGAIDLDALPGGYLDYAVRAVLRNLELPKLAPTE